MKNLLALTFVALAASLFAESKFISGAGFELDKNPVGEINLAGVSELTTPMWGGLDSINTKDITKIVEYEDDNHPGMPDLPENNATNDLELARYNRAESFTNSLGKNTRYLEIDSGDTLVARKVKRGNYGVTLTDDGLYVDTMVQFTPTDIPPEPVSQVDKLLVWLYEQPDSPTTKNLMITAGSYSGTSYKGAVEYTIPTSCVEVRPNTWYRLTITMELYYYSNFNSDWCTARFKVYIDDKQVVAEDGTSAFMSLIPYTQGNTFYKYNELRQLGFSGDGAVDNIVFASGTPYPIEDISYKIAVGAGIDGFSYSTNEIDWVEADIIDGVCTISDVAYLRKTIYIDAISYKEGYTLDAVSPTSAVVNEDGILELSARPLRFVVTPEGGESIECSSLADFAEGGVISGNIAISLMADYTLADDEYMVVYGLDDVISLDLKGHTLTVGNSQLIVADCTFVITDSVGGGKIAMASEGDVLIMLTSGSIIIENADVTFEGAPILLYPSSSKISIKGGKFSHEPVDQDGGAIPPKSYAARGYELAKGEGEQYYTIKEIEGYEEEEVPVDEVASTTYDSEAEAQAAAESIIIVAPPAAGLDAGENDTYSGYVRPKVIDKGDGTYVLNVVFQEDVVDDLQEAADEGAEAALSTADGEDVSISVVPGLYYTLEQGATLPLEESETKLAPAKAETLSFTIKRDAMGFYRVIVSPTNPEN